MKRHDHHQVSLFTPTTTIVDKPTATHTTPTTAQPASGGSNNESLNIEITHDELAAQVIQGFVKHRRWEKELVVGATDEDLALGNCWASNAHLHIHCNTEPTPHVICTTPMGQELLRLEAAEIASLVRTHAGIQTVPSDEEGQRRLIEELDRQRAAARNDIFTSVQSILGDKSRKREQGFTQQFVNLLLTENCLEEQNESATLETITSMLIAREWTKMKAMKAAIQLVDSLRTLPAPLAELRMIEAFAPQNATDLARLAGLVHGFENAPFLAGAEPTHLRLFLFHVIYSMAIMMKSMHLTMDNNQDCMRERASLSTKKQGRPLNCPTYSTSSSRVSAGSDKRRRFRCIFKHTQPGFSSPSPICHC